MPKGGGRDVPYAHRLRIVVDPVFLAMGDDVERVRAESRRVLVVSVIAEVVLSAECAALLFLLGRLLVVQGREARHQIPFTGMRPGTYLPDCM